MQLDIANGQIEMKHGSGGRASWQLIEQIFMQAFANEWLDAKNDQACFSVPAAGERMVMSVDSHVVTPLFFPGGDIGSLAVNGTVNDVAMAGAKPLYLSASFILEEGLPLRTLQRVVNSMAAAAKCAGVAIVTGDTKVVERGKGDGVYITTTGVGVVPAELNISSDRATVGDVVIVSGYLGDHGVAVMSQRPGTQFATSVQSDCAALNGLVADLVAAVPDIHCLRDPTRGGLAAVLHEFAEQSQVGFMVNEKQLPIRDEVLSACELLGIDPLYIANEGKLVAICKASDAERILEVMHAHPLGQDARICGEVVADERKLVTMRTELGGKRLVTWLTGEQLPRIC